MSDKSRGGRDHTATRAELLAARACAPPPPPRGDYTAGPATDDPAGDVDLVVTIPARALEHLRRDADRNEYPLDEWLRAMLLGFAAIAAREFTQAA